MKHNAMSFQDLCNGSTIPTGASPTLAILLIFAFAQIFS